MTTISQMIGQSRYGTTVGQNGGQNPAMGTRQNDGYSSFGGSVLRNAAIGAAAGAVIALPTGFGLPIGAGIGAVVGAGSALIRHPRVASAVGDGIKASLSGAAGGALVGTVTPFGPVGGAVAGAVGGFLTGTVSGMLKKVSGGKYSIEGQTTVIGRVKQGLLLGAASGAVVGAGAGLLFGGIGALPGALWGAAIGGIGGAFHGLTSGTIDAATGAKGASFVGGGKSILPHLGGRNSNGDDPNQYPGQVVQQMPIQYAS